MNIFQSIKKIRDGIRGIFRNTCYTTCCFESKEKKIEQKRFQIKVDSMQIKSVKKTQFAGLNNEHFYFHDGIVSLPFGQSLLKKVREKKEKHQADLHMKIQKKKNA